jgi:hypothetical protein
MKVKNNYSSHLGFGDMRILPGETKELPKSYGGNHPLTKFYISKGWLTFIEGTDSADNSSVSAVNVSIDINTGDDANSTNTEDNTDNEVNEKTETAKPSAKTKAAKEKTEEKTE